MRLNHAVLAAQTCCMMLVVEMVGYANAQEVPAGGGTSSEAAEVLDRFVRATGGRDAYERLYNRVSKFHVEYIGMGFVAKGTTYTAAPNLRFTDIYSDALGRERHGTDGSVVWHLADRYYPMIEGGQVREANVVVNAFDLKPNWRKYYREVVLVGDELVDGILCHKVEVTLGDGKTDTHYYAKHSGLLVKMLTWHLNRISTVRLNHLTLGDYKWVDGILLPHRMLHGYDLCGSKREELFITDSIVHNVDLPGSTFNPPPEISEVKEPNSPNVQLVQAQSAPCGAASATKATSSSCSGQKPPAVRPQSAGEPK